MELAGSGEVGTLDRQVVVVSTLGDPRRRPPTLHVYFLLDADWEVLYVGRSHDPIHRHRTRQDRWKSEVEYLISTRYATPAEARTAELQAIRNARPKYNRTGNPDWVAQVSGEMGQLITRGHRDARRRREHLRLFEFMASRKG
jgi:hypothetical protein